MRRCASCRADELFSFTCVIIIMRALTLRHFITDYFRRIIILSVIDRILLTHFIIFLYMLMTFLHYY